MKAPAPAGLAAVGAVVAGTAARAMAAWGVALTGGEEMTPEAEPNMKSIVPAGNGLHLSTLRRPNRPPERTLAGGRRRAIVRHISDRSN